MEYGLFSGFFMNKFACRKKMPIDIFFIFCHDILAMILFRILTKVRGYMCLFFSYRTKNRTFFMTNLDIVNFGAKLPYNAGADPGFQVRGGRT